MNIQKSSIFIVLPAYNEEGNIKKLLEKLVFYLVDASLDEFKIVVVDDGSHDRTAERIEQFGYKDGVVLIRHSQNQGLAFPSP